MTFATIDLTPTIGSEIKIDKATMLRGSEAAALRCLLEQRGVLVFRTVGMTDAEQVAFGRTLGEVIDQGENNIYKITMDMKENERAYSLKGAFYWHIDGTADDVPTRASILTARRLAPTGGETEFANTYAAFDALSASDKHRYEKLRVVHSHEASQRVTYPDATEEQVREWRQITPKTHPLVWTHRSGRKSLVVGVTTDHVVGMDPQESRELLDNLLAWTTQPQFVCRHEWTLGDLVIWDNTGVMHRALPYAMDSGRMMHRTTLVGEEALV